MASPQLMTGLGAASAIFLTSLGSGLASAPAGMFALRSTSMRCMTPIIIAGVLAIYGIIIAVILTGKFKSEITEMEGYKYLSSGLSVGLACLASGIGMTKFLNSYIAAPVPMGSARVGENEPLLGSSPLTSTISPPSIKFLCVMVFLEAIGLYGLIVALLLSA